MPAASLERGHDRYARPPGPFSRQSGDVVRPWTNVLAEMAKEPRLIVQIAREHLQGIMYHKLPKVDVLYRIALEFRTLNLAVDKDSLFATVLLRHDCVHRNGSDMDGQELKVGCRPLKL